MARDTWERNWRAARLLRALSSSADPLRAPQEERIVDGDERIDYYAPLEPTGACLVLLHGVTARGATDRRLVGLARAMAAEGVSSFVPQLQGLAEFREEPADLKRIKRAILRACGQAARAPSLLGFSVGAGLGLVVAADREVSSKLARVVAVGAHHRLGEVWDRLSLRLRSLPSRLGSATDGELYAALGMAAQRLGEEALGEAPLAELRTLLWNYCESADLTTSRRFVRERLLEHWAVIEVSQESPQSSMLSPAGTLRHVTAPVALLHAPDDELVPAEHARRNSEELAQRGDTKQSLLLTPLLDHVQPRIMRGLWQVPKLVGYFAELMG